MSVLSDRERFVSRFDECGDAVSNSNQQRALSLHYVFGQGKSRGITLR